MQRRIATIVTQFRAAGLPAVTAAVRAAAAAVAQVRAGAARAAAAAGNVRAAVGRAAAAISARAAAAARALAPLRQTITNVVSRLGAVRNAAARGLGAVSARAGPAVRSLGRVAAASAAAGVALAALAKTSALAFIHSSVEDTVEDLKQLRQTAALTRMSPEFVSFWQRFAGQSGIEKEDVSALFGAFNTAVSEAASDPESGFAALFKDLNIQLKDSAGNLRNVSHLFGELAIKQRQLSAQKRGFYLAQIFGDGDSLKAAEFFDKVADLGVDGSNKLYREQLDAGNLVSPEQVQLAKDYEAALVGLKGTYATLKRLVFEQVGQNLVDLFRSIEAGLSKNKKTIADYLGGIGRSAIQLTSDLAAVFLGLETAGVKNAWLYDMKELLLAIVELGKLAARALVGVLRAADGLFARFTGLSVVDWARSLSVDDLEAAFSAAIRWATKFVRDVRTLLGSVWDKNSLKTGLGRWIGVALQYVYDAAVEIGAKIRSEIDGVVGYFRTAFREFSAAEAAGTGTAGMTTALGTVLISVKDAADAIRTLYDEFHKVFALGQQADAGFEWIEDLHTVLDSALGTLSTFVGIMQALLSPLQAIILLFGDWSAAGTLLAGTVLLNLTNLLTGGLLGAGIKAGLTALIAQFAGAGGLAAAATSAGAVVGAAVVGLGAFAAAAAATAAALALVWNAIPEKWRNGIMDTIGASDATVGADFLRYREGMDADLNRYGIKPGALSTWQAMNPTVSAPLGGGKFFDPVEIASTDRTPVDINIAGLPTMKASMSPSELDAARAMQLRRYG